MPTTCDIEAGGDALVELGRKMYLVLVSHLVFRKVPTKVPTNCWYLVVLECIALD